MIWSLALVPVGQQQHDRGVLLPLGATRGDELIDDHLRDVREVAVLSLTEHERVGCVYAVAVLEAERPRLGQRTVVDGEGGTSIREML